MTIEEASNAVEKALDAREDAIQELLGSASLDLFEALTKLHETDCAYSDALEVWGELNDAQKKSS